MTEFTGSMLFSTQDHECIQTVANRIVEILPGGAIDRRETYDEYLDNPDVPAMRERLSRAE